MTNDQYSSAGRLGPLVILSGPSGAGKTTLIARLLTEASWPLRLSVSVTTRAPRDRERAGVHYYYWTREQFEDKINQGEFLEWAEVYGNYYGTLQEEVMPYREKGIGVILDIDTQGWERVKKCCPDAVSVFLMTSSPEVYEKRLRERGTESKTAIARRLQGAALELARAPEYDYQVMNDDVQAALASLKSIVEKCFSVV